MGQIWKIVLRTMLGLVFSPRLDQVAGVRELDNDLGKNTVELRHAFHLELAAFSLFGLIFEASNSTF